MTCPVCWLSHDENPAALHPPKSRCQSSTEQAIQAAVDAIDNGRGLTEWSIELMCDRGTVRAPASLSTARNTSPKPDAVVATQHDREHVLQALQATFESFDRARAAGVTIAAGPDCGSRCDPGDNAGELARIVEAGLPLTQAIQVAIRERKPNCGGLRSRLDRFVRTLDDFVCADPTHSKMSRCLETRIGIRTSTARGAS